MAVGCAEILACLCVFCLFVVCFVCFFAQEHARAGDRCSLGSGLAYATDREEGLFVVSLVLGSEPADLAQTAAIVMGVGNVLLLAALGYLLLCRKKAADTKGEYKAQTDPLIE